MLLSSTVAYNSSSSLQLPKNHLLVSRLRKVAGNQMPVIRDLDLDPQQWVVGLPDISRHLEERHPETPLGTIDTAAGNPTSQAPHA